MNPLLACWDVPIALTKVRAKPTTRDAALQWFDTGTRVVRSEVASSTAWNRNLLLAPSALEPSMNVDDAGALGKGGLKVEGALNRDDKVRGGELVFGFAPIDDLEVGLGLARATDHDLDPSTKLRGTGIGYPWVPIQNDSGWSLGVRSDMSRMRADERFALDTITEGEYAFFDLVTFRFESGQVLHLNLGAKRTKAGDESESVGTWGVGYKHPLAKKRNLTAEIFGEAYAGPDKAVGLRYEIAEGFKISGAVGCGNDRSFA